MIFDSHFHLLTMYEKKMDLTLPEHFIGLECGTVPHDAEERIKLVGNNSDIYLSIGAGPWCTGKGEKVESIISSLSQDILKYGADAIGECGFDNHWKDYGKMNEQLELFIRQKELSDSLNVPLIIHSREADDVLIENIKYIDESTIMHCFSSSKEIMYKLLDRGAYISFAGNVTYKQNYMIKEAAKECPLSRILYETDSPYLTPVPKRGELNRVENTEYTLSFIAKEKKIEREIIKENAIKNFLTLMKNRKSIVKRDTTFL